MNGFGWNFYAFFLGAAIWVACYLLWAWRVNTRDQRTKR